MSRKPPLGKVILDADFEITVFDPNTEAFFQPQILIYQYYVVAGASII